MIRRSFHPLLLAPAFLQAAAALFADEIPRASAEQVYRHVEFLARDELGGRDSGEPGLEVAAEYIANRYREYGLEPAGDGGTYFQSFTVPYGAAFADGGAVSVTAGGAAPIEWTAGSAVEAFGFADNEGEASGRVDAPLVYAGYGITATEEDRAKGLDYDDYAGIDVRGKVVLLLRFTPRHGSDDDPFGGRESAHAPLLSKLLNARDHSAAGAILVTPPGVPEESLYGVAHRAAPRQPTLPAVLAQRAAIERLFALRGLDLERLVAETREDLTPRSFEVEGVRVRFATTRGQLRLRNVIGRLEGSDPELARESILIGAHYDHIGRYGNQVAEKNLGEIHNGADDNASGVAGVLELARLFASSSKPRRSLLFACFSGEEIGLLGSRHFVAVPRFYAARSAVAVRAHPAGSGEAESGGGDGTPAGGNGAPGTAVSWTAGTILAATGEFRDGLIEVTGPSGTAGWVDPSLLRRIDGPAPLQDVAAMVNLDMIGHAGSKDEVTVLGADSAKSFPPLLEEAAAEEGLKVNVSAHGFAGGSDHMHFQRRGIPVLFFFTGLHKRYNTPEDDVETLDIAGIRRVVDLVHRVTVGLASRDERPIFDPASIARVGGGHGRPLLGVQLDTEYRGEGVRVLEVLPASVAEKAGVLTGDVILELDGEAIRSVPELLRALEKHSSGAVKLAVRRGGEDLVLRAEFPERRGGFRVRFGSIPDYAFAEQGVRFEDIAAGSPAAKAGVQPGDILVAWEDHEVRDVEHWTALLGEHRPGDRVKFRVRRGEELVELEVTLEAR